VVTLVLGLTALLGGLLLLLGLTPYLYVRQKKFLRKAVEVTGVVVDFRAGSSGGGGTMHHPVVEFRTEDGEVVEFASPYGQNPPAYRVGQRVPVLYDPDRPETAALRSFASLWLACLVTALLGATLTCCVSPVALLVGALVPRATNVRPRFLVGTEGYPILSRSVPMYTCKFLAACVFVGVAGAVALAQPGERVPVLDQFEGTAAKDKKPDLKTGFVATEADWKEAWEKVNPKAKLPKVDFAKHVLLVTERDAADPNRRSVSVLKDDKGTVKLSEVSTLIGFKPSDQTTYRFYKVSREGVTAVRYFDPAKQEWVVNPLPK
jgi:Protein of unknown function (DUF3592)